MYLVGVMVVSDCRSPVGNAWGGGLAPGEKSGGMGGGGGSPRPMRRCESIYRLSECPNFL